MAAYNMLYLVIVMAIWKTCILIYIIRIPVSPDETILYVGLILSARLISFDLFLQLAIKLSFMYSIFDFISNG